MTSHTAQRSKLRQPAKRRWQAKARKRRWVRARAEDRFAEDLERIYRR